MVKRQSTISALASKRQASLAIFTRAAQGATLVEGLIAMVILAIITTMSITLFNAIMSFINGTSEQARLSAEIDANLSRIHELSQVYNACTVASGGAVSSTCGAYTVANSYLYFPDPTNTSDVTAFDQACNDANPSSHITANFINAVNALPVPAGVERTVSREDDNPNDHRVAIEFKAASGINRKSVLVPYQSYWCP